ncbi:MAG: 4-(cytidine 5'-diphospho)-2-C-methyl-D-erythritol kinase [Solirubrobacterales bacterium]|nr:4-(cytidine 5'-diphospho)-2-C-methyl-D-erythritol kinase [Solirubrobacterales bacterium]
MTPVARAPGKVNLCLFLGPIRADGRHELVTMFESVSLADEVALAVAAAEGVPDQVVCPGVEGANIVTQTLEGLRARGWAAPPVRVVIEKRIPVAGGMAGGSADAAAVLRLAPALAPVPVGVVEELAVALGADVPSALVPGVAIGSRVGDVVERIGPLAPHAFVIVPQPFGLLTGEVFREADRLGLPRDQAELAERLRSLRATADPGFVNDLEPAAVSLRPEIGDALDAVRAAGADHAMVSGSGPTVFGVFDGADAAAEADAAAARLAERYPGAVSAAPVSEEFGAPRGS